MNEINQELGNVLSNNFLAVEVRIRRWSGSKTDRSASEELAANKSASRGAAKVVKDLMAGARAELKNVHSIQDSARTMTYTHTLPYSTNTGGANRGPRLLPVLESMDYIQKFKKIQQQYKDALTEFLSVYDQRRAEAMANLGGLADANDYPTATHIRGEFGLEIQIQPLPSTINYSQMSLSGDVVGVLSKHLADQQQTAMENAMTDLHKRITEQLGKIVDVFGKVGRGEKTKVFDSLIGNLNVFSGLLKANNFADDDAINELVAGMEEIGKLTAKQYKQSPDQAKQASEKAAKLVSKVHSTIGTEEPAPQQDSAVSEPAPPCPTVAMAEQQERDEIAEATAILDDEPEPEPEPEPQKKPAEQATDELFEDIEFF